MVKCEEEESGMSDKNLYSKRKWCVIQAKIDQAYNVRLAIRLFQYLYTEYLSVF